MSWTNHDLCLPDAYQSRFANNVGLHTTSYAQLRVYRYAATLLAADPAVQTVLDYGCGDGWKLVNLLGRYETMGADVDYRLPVLRARYPDRQWAAVPVPAVADVVLCVDVIEHVDDPIALLRHFRDGTWRHLLISTPERALVAQRKYADAKSRRQQLAGPPMNRWHAREWTASEFARLFKREIKIAPTVKILGRWNLVAYARRP